MTVTILSIDTIVSNPNIRNGQPIIAGTTLRVTDVVASHLYRGHTPEDLAIQFKLTLAQVHAALAYYYLHKNELDTQIRQDAAEADILLAELDEQQ